MTGTHLPPALAAALAVELEGQSRAPLAAAHEHLSATYRAGGSSDAAIGDAAAALAYATARMPATYAAAIKTFDMLADVSGSFAPLTHLDLGAGPGTAAFAARAVWPSLSTTALVEPNTHLAALGVRFAARTYPDGSHVWRDARLDQLPPDLASADLVTLGYVLAELKPKDIEPLLEALRPLIKGVLVIIEPGTPPGFQRILRARQSALAHGARILAPCPNHLDCPLNKSDWCHFDVRLQRSAAHKALKVADVPFEDEPFSCLALTFDTAMKADIPEARLLRDPDVEKGFAELTVCAGGRRETRKIMRRDKAAYQAIKHLANGSAIRDAAIGGSDQKD